MLKTLNDYTDAIKQFSLMPDSESNPHIANLAKNDLFFLFVFVLKRRDGFNQFVLDRCREIEAKPYEILNLWARGHYKSSLITFAWIIKEIINNPEITIGIFSHTSPIATDFLRQIKTELERNQLLKDLFPDIFYQEPKKEAPRWSEDGIVVKRKNNPKEATLEAWGVVEGQPIGRHFDLLVYDDLVTPESVNTPEQINKTTERLRLSFNLGTTNAKRIYIGTRYHFADTYQTLIDSGLECRMIPATKDGTLTGQPVFFTPEKLKAKVIEMGMYVFSCQMLQNPVTSEMQVFKPEWLKYYNPKLEQNPKGLRYILVDPAGSKKDKSDYTVMWVIDARADGNLYILDVVRDRLNLTERAAKLFELHEKYQPKGLTSVRYEKYGLQSDIEHIEYEMERRGYRFTITQVAGSLNKQDRIKRLIPYFENSRIYFPLDNPLIDTFKKEEFSLFPVAAHDDMLDALARIAEPDFPIEYYSERKRVITKGRNLGIV